MHSSVQIGIERWNELYSDRDSHNGYRPSIEKNCHLGPSICQPKELGWQAVGPAQHSKSFLLQSLLENLPLISRDIQRDATVDGRLYDSPAGSCR